MIRNRISKFIIFSVLILLFTACKKEGSSVSLLGEWEYLKGFDKTWLSNVDPGGWKKIDAPGSFTSIAEFDKYEGLITMRKLLPSDINRMFAEGLPVAFASGRISNAAEVYFNDMKIGSIGSVDPHIEGNDRWCVENLPYKAFKKDQSNYINIVVYKILDDGGIRGPLMDVGNSGYIVHRYYRDGIISLMLITIYFVMGLFILVLGLMRLKDIHNLYFGIFCIANAFFSMANIEAKGLIFPLQYSYLYFWSDKFALMVLVPALALFISTLYHKKHSKIPIGVTVFFTLLGIYEMINVFILDSATSYFFEGFYLGVFVAISYVLFETGREVIRKNRDAIFLVIGLIFLILAGVHDILVQERVIVNITILSYAFLAFIIGITILLVNRFIGAQNKMEVLNEELDEKLVLQKKQFEELNSIYNTVVDVSSSLSSSADEMSSTSASFSDNSQSQASSIEEMSAGTEELMASSDRMMETVMSQVDSLGSVMDKLKGALEASNRAESEMQQALVVKNDLNETITETGKGINEATRAIGSVNEKFEEMTRVSAIINDIADQINLLSLNAAIEAARAGEYGRGFAVVADEIGKLADNTTENLKSITGLFNESRQEISNANMRIQSFSESLKMMLDNISRFGDSIETVAKLINETTGSNTVASRETDSVLEKADNVKNSSYEQQKAVAEVNEGLQSINLMSQEIATGAEELRGTSDEISSALQKLKKVVISS